MALWFGDDTARRAGRLTLNPIPHIDPFGSIILPAMGALAGIPVIGWAKPVPVNPNRLRNPRRDMLLRLAGRARRRTSLLMVAAAFVARSLYQPAVRRRDLRSTQLSLPVQIALSFAVVNLFLGAVQPPADPAARRRGAARAGAAARVAARLVPLPALRDARDLRARVLGRRGRGHLFDPFLRRLVLVRPAMSARASADCAGSRISWRGSSTSLRAASARRRDASRGSPTRSSRPSCDVWEGMGRADRAEARRGRAPARGRARRHRPTRPTRAGARRRSCTTSGKQASGYGPSGGSWRRSWSRSGAARTGRGAGSDPSGRRARPDGPLRRPRRPRRRAAAPRPGARPEVAAWAGAHHRPERWAAPGSRRRCAGPWPPPTASPTRLSGRSGSTMPAEARIESSGSVADTTARGRTDPRRRTSCASTSRRRPLAAHARRARAPTGPIALGRSGPARRRRRRRFTDPPGRVVLARARSAGSAGRTRRRVVRRPGSTTGSTRPAAIGRQRERRTRAAPDRRVLQPAVREPGQLSRHVATPRSRKTRTPASGSA